MARTLRRFLVLIALMFWQGGFTFYSAVVVPLGSSVFGPLDQGFLTFRVTRFLNLAGLVALLILGIDLLGAADPAVWRRWGRWLSWVAMVLALVLLFWLHQWLTDFMDVENMQVLERKTFRTGHRVYLWTSTVQWGFGLVYVWLTLWAWRAEDRVTMP